MSATIASWLLGLGCCLSTRYIAPLLMFTFLRVPTHVLGQRAELTLIRNDTVLQNEICPMTVQVMCTVEDLPSLRWFFNGSEGAVYVHILGTIFPPAIELVSPFPGISIQIINATQGSTVDNTNALSLLTANILSAIQILRGLSIQCGSNAIKSDEIIITDATLGTSPSMFNTSCFLSPVSGGYNFSLQWFPSSNNQYSGDQRYNVTVTPDPSSCSSQQVSPSEDYSCSGLDLQTNYTITVSPINCEDQEGESIIYTVLPPDLVPTMPQGLNTSYSGSTQLMIEWMQIIPVSGNCSFSETSNYIVSLEDSKGEVVEKTVSSDSCTNGACSTNFSNLSTLICHVSIMEIGGLNATYIDNIGSKIPKLTQANTILVAMGVFIWIVAAIIFSVAIVYHFIRKGSSSHILIIVLLFGTILLVVCSILWLVVALQVGLQGSACNASWQLMRNNLVIASVVISTITLILAIAMTTCLIVIKIYQFITKKRNYTVKACKKTSDQSHDDSAKELTEPQQQIDPDTMRDKGKTGLETRREVEESNLSEGDTGETGGSMDELSHTHTHILN